MFNTEKFVAVQNGVILGIYDSHEEAFNRVKEEQRRDMFSIIFRRKFRKLFKKSGNVALHHYEILTLTNAEEVPV